MKRILALVLSVLMVLTLFACSGGDNDTNEDSTANSTGDDAALQEGLLIGFNRQDITPNYAVCLQGGDYKSRVSEGFRDMVTATCIAISENSQTYLIYTIDVKLATPNFVDPAKELISSATGISKDNIILNATHTHSGVAVRYNWDKADQYRNELYKKLTKAAEKAIEDMSPAEVYSGSVWAEGMNWVRHYKTNDGGYAGANFGDHSSGYAGHVHEADNELQLVRFVRADDDKKDVILATFPTHATFNESGKQISADFPGPFRDYVEEQTDTHVAYFIAAAGNQVPSSRIAGEQFSKDYIAYGKELGRYAVEGLANMTKIEGEAVKLQSLDYTAGTNKENVDKLNEAKIVQEISSQFGASAQETKNAVALYGFQSRLEAGWLVTRSNLPETRTMTLRVMSIGDLAIAFAPYEMFGQQGVFIKDNSPFDNTVIVTCSEGDNSYIPDEASFEYWAYEAYVSYYERGTAEKAAEEFVNMLTQLKGEA